ncbi:Fcf1-domain-containing protein [Podospora appendiculata]|uniref:U three protein 23 n=1 Tax=Podospora appendiculata TaxID=314037 RepID=A0AAE1CGU8_9PEZI|nr:Fcf1-domain-containing protein [Podospora appendiculata]
MGKRIKQYKRLMRDFEFLGFRSPYQVLMTSDVILETLKVDLVHLFNKALSTKEIKPMITQCCIRALYGKNMGPNRDPAAAAAIERAKDFERRRCGHLMDQDPLTERECMMSVVDPKGKGENKFRYIVATQDEELREKLRSVVPTPLMYVKRSVLILEPMSQSSAKVRQREERAKFTDGIVRRPKKRKREGEDDSGDDDEDGDSGSDDEGDKAAEAAGEPKPKKKKKAHGKKGPNPLAVKKAKKETGGEKKEASKTGSRKPAAAPEGESSEQKAKRKRRKKTSAATEGAAKEGAQAGEAAAVEVVAAAPAED